MHLLGQRKGVIQFKCLLCGFPFASDGRPKAPPSLTTASRRPPPLRRPALVQQVLLTPEGNIAEGVPGKEVGKTRPTDWTFSRTCTFGFPSAKAATAPPSRGYLRRRIAASAFARETVPDGEHTRNAPKPTISNL